MRRERDIGAKSQPRRPDRRPARADSARDGASPKATTPERRAPTAVGTHRWQLRLRLRLR